MRKLLFIICFWTSAALAQSYPDYQRTTVNDFADLLGPTDEARLTSQLTQLKRDTGVEMTLVTLARQSQYSSNQTLEQFATGLFNHWGVGDAARNDGVMVLILRDDRAMRIELGAAYGRDWDRAAQRVIDDHFLDAFAAGNYARGIMEGSDAVIEEIVLRFQAGDGAPSGSDSGIWLVAVFLAVFAAIKGRESIGDALARLRKCPRCGRRGLRQTRRVTTAATTSTFGWGKKRVHCVHCDYETETAYAIAQISNRSSSGFGGGSSGGGGASGRW